MPGPTSEKSTTKFRYKGLIPVTVTVWTRTGEDVFFSKDVIDNLDKETSEKGIALSQEQKDFLMRAAALSETKGFGYPFLKEAYETLIRGKKPDLSKMPDEIKSRKLHYPDGRVIKGDGKILSPGRSAELRDPFESAGQTVAQAAVQAPVFVQRAPETVRQERAAAAFA